MNTKKFDLAKSFLKIATYGVIGTVSTSLVQLIGEGMNIKEALIYGVSIGIVAGMKNIVKHYFGIDLDFTKIKK